MVRRRIAGVALVALVGAGLLTMLTGPAALAAGPVHTKLDSFQIVFPAGQFCPFAAEWDITASPGNNQLVFTKANGDVVVRQAGPQRATVWNLNSRASIDVRGGFRVDVTTHSDGSVDVDGSGTILASYLATDVGGPGMWFLKGHVRDGLDANFNTVSHWFVGNASNLCAALS